MVERGSWGFFFFFGDGEMRDYGRPQLQLPIFAAIGLCCGSRGGFWVVPVSEVRALQGVREWGPESVLGEGV